MVIDFINGILDLAGIKGEKPTFTRSCIVNTSETIANVLQAASYLSEDYVTQKLLHLLGDGDKAEEVLKQIDRQDIGKFNVVNAQTEEEEGTAEEGQPEITE